MGQLVFQAALGGQVNLVGPNTASTFNLNVPAATDTLVGRATTDTLTNKTLTSPVVSGGTIDNAVIGGTTAVAGSFTTVTASTSVTAPFLTSAASTSLLLKSAGTTAVTIDTSQNVGLGVTPSAWSGLGAVLQINTGGTFLGASGSNSTMILGTNAHYNGSSYVFKTSSSPAALYQQNGGTHAWSYAGAATAGNTFSFTQAMTLDASGNLGIGTTSPSTRISVQRTGTGDAITWASSTGKTAYAYADGSGVAVATGASLTGTGFYANDTSSYFATYTGGSERARIDSSGNLLVGGTTQNGRLTVKNPSATGNQVIYAIQAATSTTQLASWDLNQTTDVSTFGTDYGAPLAFKTNATEKARIDSSGNLLVGKTSTALGTVGSYITASGEVGITRDGAESLNLNRLSSDGQTLRFFRQTSQVGSVSVSTTLTTYNTTSDYRVKTNQSPLTGSGAFIDALQPKTWNWVQDGSKGAGFIAHEFAEVSPSSVNGIKDAVGSDGKPVYQSMQASSPEVIANLVAEIQSLRQRLTAAGI